MVTCRGSVKCDLHSGIFHPVCTAAVGLHKILLLSIPVCFHPSFIFPFFRLLGGPLPAGVFI